MKRFFQRFLVLYIIGMCFLFTMAGAETLDADYTWSAGEMAALHINLFFQTAGKTLVEQHDAPVLAVYDESERKMILNVYAAQNMLGIAQTALLMIAEFVEDDCIPYLRNNHGFRLDMTDVIIHYRNRNEEGMKIILSLVNGEFVFPGTE